MVCGMALLAVSCTTVLPPLISFARFSPSVDQGFQLKTNTAVVYGRFTTGADFAFGNELAVRLRNDEAKREYLIRCRDKDAVSAIAVEPGRYRIAGFVATFVDRRTAGRRNFPNSPSFEVPPNAVTYVGDISGQAKITALGQQWRITGITNNFVQTTVEFRSKYPHLAEATLVSVYEPQAVSSRSVVR